VDGSTPVDLFFVGRRQPLTVLRKEIAKKEQKYVCYSDEGVCRMDLLDASGSSPSLTDPQALELARLAVRIEDHYGAPQDIEWAVLKDGSIVLLQCRPLRQMEFPRDNHAQVPKAETRPAPILQGGMTASPGVAAGPVFVIRKDMDVLRFPEGAVLVAAQALPRWATALGRACAVVTERGSIAGHLANVSREYGLPALFGLHGVLGSIENGQLVTVDADGLAVYPGRVEPLLQSERPAARNLMAGSPIYESLQQAAKWIVPLHLLDPDSPAFKAENCRTFHDITRFCHEKSVTEMFRFGRDHHFPERSSKQLICNVPMKWWILNLDDGFREEVDGKYVQLENIVSIPMLALWEGITARPWEGPPPVDGKGFMSVMFRATTNTALEPGVRSNYGDRNYFMISKHFCSLTSRLGFHFSTVEALVGDRTSENYISFHFKGGAADDRRKVLRILFIQEILEQYGFRVEVKEDTLMARMEDHERAFMEERLRVLGYLTIHTRQLDMIMRNRASVNHYRTKILKELEEILVPSGGAELHNASR
jgi:pyruvate,water dikinase